MYLSEYEPDMEINPGSDLVIWEDLIPDYL